ncbi:MAG: T4SS-associated protein EirA [Pseudomonadota bacterium]|nr:T4SS-associated protein EirA [Pseudomonadota bacterium]
MKTQTLLILTTLAISQFSQASTVSYSNTENAQSQETVLYCPDPSLLVKKNLKWEATTRTSVWKSSESSFADSVASFSGVQWQGVKVGQITCIYKSGTEGVFPITLQNNHLFKQPNQKTWSMGEGGVMNCVSNKIKDCPLLPNVKDSTPTSTREVFESLDINR